MCFEPWVISNSCCLIHLQLLPHLTYFCLGPGHSPLQLLSILVYRSVYPWYYFGITDAENSGYWYATSIWSILVGTCHGINWFTGSLGILIWRQNGVMSLLGTLNHGPLSICFYTTTTLIHKHIIPALSMLLQQLKLPSLACDHHPLHRCPRHFSPKPPAITINNNLCHCHQLELPLVNLLL